MPQGSVISPTLFLLFLYSFADDSSLCHSYSYNVHPNLDEVGVIRNCIDDTLNSDAVKLEEKRRANRVEFYARKTQCCLEIVKSEILDVLGTSIGSDFRWDDHVFILSKEAAKCLSFLRR